MLFRSMMEMQAMRHRFELQTMQMQFNLMQGGSAVSPFGFNNPSSGGFTTPSGQGEFVMSPFGFNNPSSGRSAPGFNGGLGGDFTSSFGMGASFGEISDGAGMNSGNSERNSEPVHGDESDEQNGETNNPAADDDNSIW